MIHYSNRVIPNSNSPESETATLISGFWKTGNPLYKYGKQSSSFDPTSQTEDKTMKASSYGLKNFAIRCSSFVRVDQ
jgi:hypothetical protein